MVRFKINSLSFNFFNKFSDYENNIPLTVNHNRIHSYKNEIKIYDFK